MNTLLEKISTINDMIIEGKALEAFDQFYHDDIEMQENDNPIVEGKVANRKSRPPSRQRAKPVSRSRMSPNWSTS